MNATSAVPTPGKTTPGTLLGREPLLWTNAVRAILLAAIGLGYLDLTEVQTVLVLGANEAILFLITRTQTSPNVSVVERVHGKTGLIVAGHANESVTEGATIRRLGLTSDGRAISAVPEASLADEDTHEAADVDLRPGDRIRFGVSDAAILGNGMVHFGSISEVADRQETDDDLPYDPNARVYDYSGIPQTDEDGDDDEEDPGGPAHA